ncbi:DUF2382 domain-containing protein [Microbacteriaceae bacterium 4G12]
MALTQNNLNDILNNKGTVLSSSGDKIGSVDQFYVDDASGRIAWVSVHTGLFGTSESYIPLDDATVQGNDVVVPYTKDQVKDAPKVNTDGGALEEDDQDVLYRHYGIGGTGFADRTGTTGDYTDTTTTRTDADYTGAGVGTGLGRDAGHDTSGPNTDEAMTRSEERVNVGTRQTETGRARLRKFIVTENVTTTVPVSHEEVRIEREPITDGNVGAALRGGDLTEEEHEVILHAERPVVEKETVPVERVRLDKDVVTETETVSSDVRKEEIDFAVDGDADGRRGDGIPGNGR